MTAELNLVNVFYISTWNGGFDVRTPAQLNIITGEVVNIVGSHVEVDAEGDELEFLDGQSIELMSGETLEVIDDDGYFVENWNEVKNQYFNSECKGQ